MSLFNPQNQNHK